jgi:MerR family transcriptional regulator/heat shock protein HspR
MKPAVYKEFAIKFDEPILPTTVVSRLLGIPVWALKRIDKEKIVSPPRKKNKMRLYSRNELNKLKHIWYLIKEKKVKITGLKVVLELEKKLHRKR